MGRAALVETIDQLDNIARSFYRDAKQRILDGHAVVFELKRPLKSREQEMRYHAMIGDIAKQVPINGNKIDKESFKRLLVDAFKHDTKNDPGLAEHWTKMGEITLMPALNHGGFVLIGTQTRRFPKPLACAFIEWLYAFGAEYGVRWGERPDKAANDPVIDQDTGEIMEMAA